MKRFFKGLQRIKWENIALVLITPDGMVLDEEPPLVGGYVIADIAPRQSRTVYSVIGNAFVYINIVATVLLAVSAFIHDSWLSEKKKCTKSLDKSS